MDLNIDKKILEMSKEAEIALEKEFKNISQIEAYNSLKVLSAFHKNNLCEYHFNSTTGYGYNDVGRDVIEAIYSDIFKTEDALVRGQFISGTHALSTALFALLRPSDILLSISGKPYDTLDQVIGIETNSSSLASFGVKYEQIDLINDDFDYEQIKKRVSKSDIKLIEIQRSIGYSTRKSIGIEKIKKVIEVIRKVNKEVIIMIDNCYCEFVSKTEPSEVGADIVVGSLIKNLGAGIAPNGAYIVGKKDLIKLCAERLTVAGEGKDVGPTLGMNKLFLQGLFLAPSVVASSLKVAVLTSYLLEKLGYEVMPTYNDDRADIVQTIIFKNPDDLVLYTQGIQEASPVDSNTLPIPDDMPGYLDKVIMASGSFTQGSSIELSCDGPLREPYIAYQQGSLTYEMGKIGVLNAISKLVNKDKQ